MEYRNLTELKPLPNNPRLCRDDAFQKLCKSISENKEYFEARPIILSDRTGELVILAGNMRYKAAKELKLKTVPTHLISGLTEGKEREICIRDNVSNGTFDWDALANEWDAGDLAEWGVNVPEFDEEKTKKDNSDKIVEKYIVEIECTSEREQEKLFNEMQKNGYVCRVLTL